MKILYTVYQYFFAWPLFILNTLFTAVMTIVWMPAPNARFINKLQKAWSRSFFRLMLLPVEIDGTENIEEGQSYVFVSNHQSFCDVFLIYGWLPVIFKWLMKKELRKVPFVGTACAVCGHIYVDRSNPRAAKESLQEIKQKLTNGICTVIFPEGTRSATGELGRFKRGAFQIALDTNLPIVPLALIGCHEVMPKGAKVIRYGKVKMRIGKPINLSSYSQEQTQEASDYVREQVVALQQ